MIRPILILIALFFCAGSASAQCTSCGSSGFASRAYYATPQYQYQQTAPTYYQQAPPPVVTYMGRTYYLAQQQSAPPPTPQLTYREPVYRCGPNGCVRVR